MTNKACKNAAVTSIEVVLELATHASIQMLVAYIEKRR
jgi:hypothetical protein